MVKQTFFWSCLLGMMLCSSCGGSKSNNNSNDTQSRDSKSALSEDKEDQKSETKEVESLVLHIANEKSAFYGVSEKKYTQEYKITLHMSGEAEIYLGPTMYLGSTDEELYSNNDEQNIRGSWTMREKKRGSNMVEYYDIEFVSDYQKSNWVVDKDCKELYLNWEAFSTFNAQYVRTITKVDTVYAE